MFVVFMPVLFLLTTNGVAAAGHNALASSSISAASSLPIGIESNSVERVAEIPKVKSSAQDQKEQIEAAEAAVYSYFFFRGKSTRSSSSSSSSSSNHLRQQTNNNNERSSNRMLKKHPSILPSSFDFDFDPNWNYNDPQSWMQFLPFLVLFWVCWCIMSCVCNCVRRCCCGRGGGGRGQYHRIGPNQYAYHNNNADRPILNVLWAFCCFEYCCRDNQDIGGGDCCQLCAPLVCLECCCP